MSHRDYFWSDHEADAELTRLQLIEQFYDPYTFRHRGIRCMGSGASPAPASSCSQPASTTV